MIKKHFIPILTCFLLLCFTINAEPRKEIQKLSQELLELAVKDAQLKGESFDIEQANIDINEFIATASDKEVEKAYQELQKQLPILKKQHEELLQKSSKNKPLFENQQQVALALTKAKNQYHQLNDRFNIHFSRNKNLKDIFSTSPFKFYYQNSLFDKLNNAASDEEKTLLYQEATKKITTIQQQLDDIPTQIILNIKAFKSNFNQLKIDQDKLTTLNHDVELLIEKYKLFDKKIQNYIDDASLNCNAEPVDFSCHSRCEKKVRDPIFGNYKTDYDYNCLNRCNNQESRAQQSLNQDVNECVRDKKRAIKKINTIQDDMKITKQRGDRILTMIREKESKIQKLTDITRQAIKSHAELKSNSIEEISESLNILF